MTYTWYLLDWRTPQRIVVGALTNVHRRSFPGVGATNLEITPQPSDPDSMALLGGAGQAVLTCAINVTSDLQGYYETWVRTLIDGTTDGMVTAQGIWVEDLGHDGTTELHPMDVIFGSVPASAMPGGWIGDLAGHDGLVVGDSLLAYRFAVASDARAGELQPAPPLAPYTRPVTFNLLFPPRPAQGVWTAAAEQHIDRQDNATIDLGDAFVDAAGKTVLPVTVTCAAAYDDPAPGGTDQRPGVLTGEIVTYWVSASIPQLATRLLSTTRAPWGAGLQSGRAHTLQDVPDTASGRGDPTGGISAGRPGLFTAAVCWGKRAEAAGVCRGPTRRCRDRRRWRSRTRVRAD